LLLLLPPLPPPPRGPRASVRAPLVQSTRVRPRRAARVCSAPRRGAGALHCTGRLVAAHRCSAARPVRAGGGARPALTCDRRCDRRRGREDFRQFKGETDPAKIQELLAYGRKELTVIQRQAQISQLYGSPSRSVLEERKARAASRS